MVAKLMARVCDLQQRLRVEFGVKPLYKESHPKPELVENAQDSGERSLHGEVTTKDLVLDAVGGPLFEPALNSLGEKGRMVVITTTPGKQHVCFNLLDFYRKGLRLFGLMASFLDAEESAAILRDLGPGFDAGVLRAPAIAERYPLEQAGTAYARVESGEVAGRVLLVMD